MTNSDPIADMLTRVRNALGAAHETVDIPHSKIKFELARILKREGYISDFVVEGEPRKVIRLYLKYDAESKPSIRGLRRASRPGLRQYVSCSDIPRVLGGIGTVILSTSSGIMTGQEARQSKIGGEVVCQVW